ncbi:MULTISPECIES: helix-turn-helix domain-containing protein [unclassified Streptomyces]|uniref:helix-turn-helix domain-containing protein n=1 Tax=unclassified Streptomyces TaxID=2593676 RepID=UPI003652F960
MYRYRFHPTEPQAEQLLQTFGACRWVHNEGLALRVKAWEEHRVSLGFAETSRALTGWRRARKTSWLQDVPSTVLQQSLRHLDSAGKTALPPPGQKYGALPDITPRGTPPAPAVRPPPPVADPGPDGLDEDGPAPADRTECEVTGRGC